MAVPPELAGAWEPQPQPSTARSQDNWSAGGRSSIAIGVRMPRLAVCLVIVLAMAAVAAGTIALHRSNHPAQASPQTYSVGRYKFVASFPTAPAVTSIAARFDRLSYTETIYSAYQGSSYSSVEVFPFPIGKPKKTTADAFLRRFVARSRTGPGGARLTPGRATTVQGLPSLWLAAAFNGGNTAFFGVIVLDGHVAYELVEMGPATTVNTDFERSLQTFRIVDPGTAFVRF